MTHRENSNLGAPGGGVEIVPLNSYVHFHEVTRSNYRPVCSSFNVALLSLPRNRI